MRFWGNFILASIIRGICGYTHQLKITESWYDFCVRNWPQYHLENSVENADKSGINCNNRDDTCVPPQERLISENELPVALTWPAKPIARQR